MALSLLTAFEPVPDPRQQRNLHHNFTDILTLATCAVLAGAESWEAIAEYGRAKLAFFERFLELENGIPSHDTFLNVFSKLDPVAFSQAFGRWMAAACQASGLVPVAIDGKSVRRSSKATATGCLHLVSAFATQSRITLGQVSVPEGSNEIAVIPDLLALLDLAGAIVTIDAAGCQTEIARQIRKQGGEYLLAVKGNQPTLQAAVETAFADGIARDYAGSKVDQHHTVEDGHGRHEERYVTVLTDPKGLPPEWPDAACLVQVNREREVDGKNTTTTHYYLSSHLGTAKEFAALIRGHWGIENGLHWVLDVVFHEDDSRTRSGHAAANLAMVRKVGVALLKKAPGKGSLVTKRLQAGWDDEFLLKVIQGFSSELSA